MNTKVVTFTVTLSHATRKQTVMNRRIITTTNGRSPFIVVYIYKTSPTQDLKPGGSYGYPA